DGTRIAWVEGVFTSGALVSEPSTNGTATPLVDNTANHFDGNPEYIRKQEDCEGKSASIIGTANPDALVGFQYKDVFQGLAGADSAKGKGGNDRICGKGGDDDLRGGAGNDKLFGAGNNDALNGGGGKDTCD